MSGKALLVIGDRKVKGRRINLSFVQFVEHAQELKKRRDWEVKVLSYARLFSGKVPLIDASLIEVVLFFPYAYWNRKIEIYPDNRIYGDKKFGRPFKIFLKKVEKTINKYYHGKRIKYLNPPEACCLDRDKKASKDLLGKSAISVPQDLKVSSFSDIQKLRNKGIDLYIKPRFGALGKGITYVDKEKVVSNFLFRDGRIISRPYEYNWGFSQIKDEQKFLNKLLKSGFICEQAIRPAIFKRKRFDFRIYVMFGRVVYMYAKSAPAQSWVTNWSQGGKIDKKKIILKSIPQKKRIQLKNLASRAACALKLNFAGIDIILSQDLKNAYVLEGNAFPGYEKGFDLMKCLLKFLIK